MGGTGLQGEGCVEYLQQYQHHQPVIRTLTRDASSPKALALAARKVHVIEGPNNVESWRRLLEGANSLFALTFTDFVDPEGEERRGKQLFDLILEQSVKGRLRNVVFSGGEKTRVESLNAKADIETYARSLLEKQSSQDDDNNKRSLCCTFLHTSFFYENLITKNQQPRYRVTDDGRFVFSLPLAADQEIAMIGARDIGRIAGRLLTTHQPTAGSISSWTIVGDLVSPNRFLSALQKALPKYQFEYNQTDFARLQKKMGPAQARLVMEMYDTYYQNGSNPEETAQRMTATKELYPKVLSLDEWTASYVVPLLKQSRRTAE